MFCVSATTKFAINTLEIFNIRRYRMQWPSRLLITNHYATLTFLNSYDNII